MIADAYKIVFKVPLIIRTNNQFIYDEFNTFSDVVEV